MSRCIIQCQRRFRQQEDGHRITDRPDCTFLKNNPSSCPSKMQWAEVYRQKQQQFFFFTVVAHYATDWNLENIHSAELRLQAKAAVKTHKQTNKQTNQRWCLTPVRSHWSSAEQILLQLTHKVSTFYFYCCHVQSAPLRIGSPPLLRLILSLHLHPSLRAFIAFPLTQRGLSWDVNHAVN